jgi:hypothetical protein
MPTLGHLVCEWIAETLPSPGDPSRPFILSDEQARFVMAWYEIDERGRFIFRRGLLQQPKGWGKSPMAAALAIAEFCGPVVPDGVDANGRPVGRPWGTGGSPVPWIQIAASSESQADSNVYSLIWEMLSVNDGAAAEKLGVDQGRTRLYLKHAPAAKLEAVTSEAGSREGQRVTHSIFDESHLWTRSTGGLRLARTIRRNAAKMDGRTIEFANAFETGAGSVAELTADAYDSGEPGVLYVHNTPTIEPTADMSDEELLPLLAEVYGGVPWIDLNRILQEVRDVGTPWNEAVRYYFNVASSALDSLVDAAQWASLDADAEREPGSRIALGFLGASADSAALIACTEDSKLYPVGIWVHGPVPRHEVEEAIAWCFDKYDVGMFYTDQRNWRSESEAWLASFGEAVVAFPANSPRRMEPLLDRFRVAVAEGQLGHDGDPVLAAHVNNARLRSAGSGRSIEEAGNDRPITAAIAAMLALEAHARMPEPKPALQPWSMWGPPLFGGTL